MNDVENAKVLYLNRPKRFTLNEARAALPQVQELTNQAVRETASLIHALEPPNLDEDEREQLSRELQKKIDRWATHITRLGAVPKGLWLVDFDSGNGFFCWRYNEESISFFHSYDQGFAGRTPIQ
ncbi:MAG TPA: DUF2203 domain-containing protein [Bdellovibrionota bacterium]|nr:DUF2203 domain-containing protein [Bdellovibrionota bacterium]